jgi:DNA-binding MarR family transcriptional regulator
MASTRKSPGPAFYDGDSYVMADSTGHLLFQLMLNMRREVDARMAQHGLTDAQWKPLWRLKQAGGGTALELSREMCVDAGAMTRMLDRLEAKGLIERVRSETDRRVVNLRLTPEGEAVAEHIPHVLAAVNNHFLRGFSRQEWTQLTDMLQRMLGNGQALPDEQEAA